MGFFRTTARGDPPNTERRLWTLYLIQHKKQEPNFEQFEQKNPINHQEQPRNPVLGEKREEY